ncbi:Transposase [Burkholderia glumae BGR1]|uniref:IS5/IS1182 family transposase n=1 Tax=Burkholderia glumae TaxID=337 RepID=A0AAP9XV01_BURGL|nr:Transposase [Burkholderia glumae BGR1]NVE25291.1 IS5/IS1182 family transposase [Burkholderia glumae]PNL05613.1 IS5/IS1182 family transposase [Burkholderia glumae]QPQ89472.1 IS5/IS1182 family transposase [Burkholderia glumae]UVS93710.1 IS5/IS1182 family transposase [Burkholderia glumae]
MGKPILDDQRRARIAPLLPPPKPHRFGYPGRKPVADRAALAGILWALMTGIRWRDLPSAMGCDSGLSGWRRRRDWQQAGVRDRLHAVLPAKLRAAEKLDFSRAVVDASSIRAVGAVGAGEKPARTLPIERDPVRSATSPPSPTECRSR